MSENLSIIQVIQKKELAIFKEFIRVCEKHQLTYFDLGGNLLVAESHQGYITCDDDIYSYKYGCPQGY